MKGYLSVCAIYKNEARYLAEWIEFHLLAGVEHFFLYDNNSIDDHHDVLAPYVRAGLVTVTDWPRFPPQVPAYDHCLEANRHDWRWMAFIDLDEFLFSPRITPVPEVLRQYEELPGVGALWVVFGTSGYKTPPPGLVLENYTWRRIWPRRPREWKSIVDPRRVEHALGAHSFRYTDPAFRAPVPTFASFDDLRLNHYLMKSEQELKVKLEQYSPDGGYKGRGWRLEPLLRTDPGCVEETILPYAPALREALGARGISTEDGRPAKGRV
jgi:hypothetical protein